MPPPSTMSSSSSNISASGLPTGSSGTTPSLPPLDNTLGAILIAEILISMLFGITTLQMYIYFNRNPRDNRWMKGAMIALWVLDAVHLSLNSHTIYHYTVLNFMNPLALLSCPWSFAIVMIIGGLSDAIVTGIFAHRIWRFGGKMWPVMFIIPPMLVGFAGATATCNYALKFPLYEDFKKHYSWTWYTTFITQSFADVAIAATVSAMLLKRRTGFRQTDSAIRTLIVYSINTGALTSSVSVASVIIYAAVPDNLIFTALAMLLPKLMLNSLLALLNSRDSIRDKSNRSEPVSIHLSNLATVSARTVTDEPSQLSGSRSQDPYASDYKDDEILTGIKITRDKVVTVSPA